MVSVCLENGKVLVRPQARPRRPAGFALIRLLYGGICNTDLELQRGLLRLPWDAKNELFVGEVVEADDRRWVGERVVGEINLALRENASGARAGWAATVHGGPCSAL